MTTIHSTSYDNLITLIKTALSGFYRLTDPNDTSNNFDSFLRQGWSLIAESGINTQRNLCRIVSYKRTFSLTISVEVYGTDSDETLYDTSVKTLLEAVSSVTQAIEADTYLSITNGKAVANVTGDTGIIPISNDTSKFIMTEIKIDVETFIGY